MLQRELLCTPTELPPLTVAGIAHSALRDAVEAPVLAYVSPAKGGAAAQRGTVNGPQQPTNPNPTTNTSGTHPSR